MMRLAARAGFSFSPTALNLRLAHPPKKQNAPYGAHYVALTSDPAGIRTQDPYIKSVMLYQLSYEILPFTLL